MGKWMEVESVTWKKSIIGRNGQCFLVTIFNTATLVKLPPLFNKLVQGARGGTRLSLLFSVSYT